MRNFLIAVNVIVIAAVIFLLVGRFKTEKKYAYINIPKLLIGYKGTQEAKKEFDAKSGVMKANVDTLGAELQAEMQKYEKERPGMTKKEKELSEQLLRNKQQQFMQYQQTMEEKIGEENKKIQQNMLDHINGFIKKYGEDNGYDFILGANSNGMLIYAKEALEVTDDILKDLNAEFDRNKKK